MTTGGQYLLKMGPHLGSPNGKIQGEPKNFPYMENGRCAPAKEHNVQLQWLYTAFTSPFDNLLKLICSKLPKMLSTPITIDGKPTPHMENPTHIRKMQLIAPLTVLV